MVQIIVPVKPSAHYFLRSIFLEQETRTLGYALFLIAGLTLLTLGLLADISV